MSNKSSILAKIRELFQAENFEADYTTIDGKTIRCKGESLKEGERIVEIIGGEEATIQDGTYELSNGKILDIEAGQVKNIKEVEKGNVSDTGYLEEKMGAYTEKEQKDTGAMVEKMEGVIETKLKDGTEVKVMVAGDQLAIGDKVEVKDAEGKFIKAPEGRHETIDGVVLYVDAEGLINEIETERTEERAENDEMRRMFEALEQLTSVVTGLKEKFESVSSTNKELKDRFEKFAAEPSTTSISKTNKTSFDRMATKNEKAKFFGSK